MKKITLTVQSTGNAKYRFAISYKDSVTFFKKRRKEVIIHLGKLVCETRTTCGPPLEKGFDLYHSNIDRWIKDHRHNAYRPGRPKKFEFNMTELNGTIELRYIRQIR